MQSPSLQPIYKVYDNKRRRVIGVHTLLIEAIMYTVFGWGVNGERQMARIRGHYVKSILRQDISWFDLQVSNDGMDQERNVWMCS